jgi:hypothetical protein
VPGSTVTSTRAPMWTSSFCRTAAHDAAGFSGKLASVRWALDSVTLSDAILDSTPFSSSPNVPA